MVSMRCNGRGDEVWCSERKGGEEYDTGDEWKVVWMEGKKRVQL